MSETKNKYLPTSLTVESDIDEDGYLQSLEIVQDCFSFASMPVCPDGCAFGDDEDDDRAFDTAMLKTAHMFAAAPDLLAVCIEANRLYSTLRKDRTGYLLQANDHGLDEEFACVGKWINALRDAIEKAQGEAAR